MAFSAVCYREGNRPQSVHGQMVVGCRDSNVRGRKLSLRVDGELEDETFEVTFSKGARQKIKHRQCWTAIDVRLMWTDQTKFLA